MDLDDEDVKKLLRTKQKQNLLKKLNEGKSLSAREEKLLGINEEDEEEESRTTLTKTDLADVYGVDPRSIVRWRNQDKVDVLDPEAVYAHVAQLKRPPPDINPMQEACKILSEKLGKKIEGRRLTKPGEETTRTINEEIAIEKLRKLKADADRVEFKLSQEKGEFISVADELAPTLTRVIEDFLSTLEGAGEELAERCGHAPSSEILATFKELFVTARENFVSSLEEMEEGFSK